MKEIELGDTVKCKYSGFIGTAVAKTEFINKCVQFSVVPKWDKKGPLLDQEIAIDSQSLIISKRGILGKEKDKEKKTEEILPKISTGGPMRLGKRARGF